MYKEKYIFSAIKKEIPPFATTQIDFKGSMLSKQVREWYHMIFLRCGIQTNKLTDTENRRVVARIGGWGVKLFKRCTFSCKNISPGDVTQLNDWLATPGCILNTTKRAD